MGTLLMDDVDWSAMTTEAIETLIRRRNLRTAWRLFHPLNRWQLEPLCEREWGDNWRAEVTRSRSSCSKPMC